MKKLLLGLVLMCGLPLCFAAQTANIKIRINGATSDNSYFLCLPNVGCLSILAAQKGKVFPVMHDIQMDNLFIVDASQNLRLSPQGRPNSCNVSVKTNQTITISGKLVSGSNGTTMVSGLRCSVS